MPPSILRHRFARELGGAVLVIGRLFGRSSSRRRFAFTALEANQIQVDFLRRFGNQVFYGDASRLEMLRAAHADNAEVVVLAIDDVEASVRTAELIAKHFPHHDEATTSKQLLQLFETDAAQPAEPAGRRRAGKGQ